MAVAVGVRMMNLANSNILKASRALPGLAAPRFSLASVGRFHCGVKSPPVFRDSCFFPRLEPSFLGGTQRQAVRRGNSGRSRVRQRGVAMKALKTSHEVDQVTTLFELGLHTTNIWNLLVEQSLNPARVVKGLRKPMKESN